jgi:hypothetical protein
MFFVRRSTVLLYLSTMEQNDAKGFEHWRAPYCHHSVLPEAMPKEEIDDGCSFP